MMPVDLFISEDGNPIIEWSKKLPTVRKHLAMGGTIKGIYDLPMNPKRALDEYNGIVDAENKCPKFWQSMDYFINDILEGQPINQVILEYKK